MDIAELPAGLVGAYGNEAEVKGTAVTADLREGGAGGEVVVGGGVVIFGWRDGGWDGAVACVAVWFTVVSLDVIGRGEEGKTYPAKYTLAPPDSTLQLAQRVLHLSNGVLALTC